MPPKNTKSKAVSKNAQNIQAQYKKKKARYAPTKSFAMAYNKLQPTKENRKVFQIGLSSNPYLIPAANVIDQLTDIAQGTQMNERMRNSIYVSYVKIYGTIAQKVANTKTRIVRIVVLREINNGDLNPATMANYFKNNNWQDSAPDGSANTSRWIVNRDRYQVFFDKRYFIRPKTEQGMTLVNANIKIGKKFFYGQTDAPNTSPIGGRLMVIASLAEPDDTLSADGVHCELQHRVFFKDNNRVYSSSYNRK